MPIDAKEKKQRRKRAAYAAARVLLDAAVAQREAYDKWLVDNGKDIGQSLAHYGAKTDECLKAAHVFMKAEAKVKERTK